MYRYQYICELGLGGRGRVVKAMDMQDGEVVALKSSSCIPSSLNEVAILNIADHPNIVRMKAAFPAEAGLAINIVMECMDGSLQGKHVQDRAMLRAILYQLLEALCYLHDTLHVAHMDIRPSNILITTSNATTIKLCDFNRASKLGSVLVCDGTPGYMAPELLMTMGITDGRPTDMWAVGATLYELCVGQPLLSVFTPTEGHLGIIRRGVDLHHIRDPMLQDLCHKLLAFDPGARITAAAALQHPFFLPTPRSTRSSGGGGMRSSGGGGEHWLAACRIACRRRTKS